MKRCQTMHRPHKLHITPAISQLVSHDFWNRQFGDGFEQRFLQAIGQCCALDGAVIKQCFSLAVRSALEPRHRRSISTQRVQFFQQRRGGVASSIQPHSDRHQFL